MAKVPRESVWARSSAVCELLQQSGDVLEARQGDEAILCIPDGPRLLRVLSVDDNRDAADSMRTLVNLWEHDARVAYDGAAALQMTSAYLADVILLDLSMPKMDGCEVAKQLRRQTRFQDTLLIALTGWTDDAHRLLCDEAGFDLYLVKPIDLSRLEILLRRERDRPKRSKRRTEPVGR